MHSPPEYDKGGTFLGVAVVLLGLAALMIAVAVAWCGG
jgi:hypothetical protein